MARLPIDVVAAQSLLRQRAVWGRWTARIAGTFFYLRSLVVPGHLLREDCIAGGQSLEAVVSFDGRHDGISFVFRNALTIVFAVLAALENVVGALGDGLAIASDLKGLLADMAANHLIDVGHFLKDGIPFVLDGRSFHIWLILVYVIYNIMGKKMRKANKIAFSFFLSNFFSMHPPEAARLLGVSTATLSRWECDKVYPNPEFHSQYLGSDPFTAIPNPDL